MSASRQSIPAAERQLKRDIGFYGAAFIAFNGAIGAGIFALPGRLHADFGGFAPWLFPLFGLLILVIAVPLGRVASHYPVSGGPVRYAARFGPLAAFQAGWLLWVARVTAIGANLNLLADYGGAAWAPLGTGAGRVAIVLIVCALIGSLNYGGVRRGMGAINLLTLLKALPLIGVALLGLWMFADSIPAPGPPPTLGALEGAALIVLYAFVGFETAVLPAGEMRDPKRIGRAMVVTLLLIILLYFLVQLAYGAAMPAGPAPDAPLAALGGVLAGAAGALILTAGAAFSVLGNVANAILSAPRVLFALGVDGLLPAWFGRVHARYATPANAVVFTTLAIVLLALTGSFVWLAAASTLARLIVYGLSIAALPGVERESAEGVENQGAGRRRVSWVLVVAALAVCLWAMLQSDWTQWRVLLALAAGGVLLYLLAARGRRSPPAEE